MKKEMDKIYNPKDVEENIYKEWEEKGYFKAEVNRHKKPFTIVMPPPNITMIKDVHCIFCRNKSSIKFF